MTAERSNNFDALRLVAAFMVLCSHQFAISGRPEPLVLGYHGYGSLGVQIFFAISGYLVKASWENDPTLWRFLGRRFLRIAPALVVCIPLTTLGVAAMGLQGFPDNPLHILNGSLWTIELEVYCYLILAVLAVMMPRAGLVFSLGMLAGYWMYRYSRGTIYHLGLLFAIGILIREYPVLRRGKAVFYFAAAGLFLLPTGHVPLTLAFIVAPLSIWIGRQSWPGVRSAGRYGDFSYGIYVYAWPVQQVGVALLGAQTHYLALLLATVIPTGTLAVLSWHFIEKPSLAFKERLTSWGKALPAA